MFDIPTIASVASGRDRDRSFTTPIRLGVILVAIVFMVGGFVRLLTEELAPVLSWGIVIMVMIPLIWSICRLFSPAEFEKRRARDLAENEIMVVGWSACLLYGAAPFYCRNNIDDRAPQVEIVLAGIKAGDTSP